MSVRRASPASTRALDPCCGSGPLRPTRLVWIRLRETTLNSVCSVARRPLSSRYASTSAARAAAAPGAMAVSVAHCSA